MSAYRFCRTDDIGLLVDALNRCWAPYVPDEPPVTAASFKRTIRDLQVWCSSCMVAFAGSEPIGVLIGAKRPTATLIHRIAVHPEHRRQGHGRHLLESLGSKLSILGPPRLVAEVPETLDAACGLFEACGYTREAVLTDYVLLQEPFGAARPNVSSGDAVGPNVSSAVAVGPNFSSAGAVGPNFSSAFVIPVSIDDLAANGLLADAGTHTCWERSVETLTARKSEIAGLAVASDERIEACILYTEGPEVTELVSLRSFVEDGGARLEHLLSRLRKGTCHLPGVHPAEIARERLERLGFRAAATRRLYAARPRAG